MRHGIVLFTCDRGITPAQAARAAEDRGFDASFFGRRAGRHAAGLSSP